MKPLLSVYIGSIIVLSVLAAACADRKKNPSIPPAVLQNLNPNITFPEGSKQGGRAVAADRHPENNEELIVASQSGGLFKSINHGTNWTQVSGSGTFWFTDVKYLPADPAIVIAAANKDTRVISGGGIWRSSNGGDSWTRVNLAAPPVGVQTGDLSGYAIDVDPASGRIWVGTSGGLVHSDDLGITWIWQGNLTVPVYSVLTPEANRIVVLMSTGISVSTDNGGIWTNPSKPNFSATVPGDPDLTFYPGLHNQLACSPYNKDHIFLNCLNVDKTNHPSIALLFTPDNGRTWQYLRETTPQWRFPFVKVVPSLLPGANLVDIYFSNGALLFDRATFSDDAIPKMVSPWNPLNVNLAHPDISDMVFETDGRTPLLITNDGGVAVTRDKGLTWVQAGSGSNGYSALQVNDIACQEISAGHSDVYFTTQDNNTWASEDNGLTWPHYFGVEGSFIQVPRNKTPANTKIVLLSSIHGQFLKKALFADIDPYHSKFPVCSNSSEAISFIRPGVYVQNTRDADKTSSVVNLTRDTGANWSARITFPEVSRDKHKPGGGDADPVLYQSIHTGYDNFANVGLIGIKRIVNTFGFGAPVLSDVTGFGSLGSFLRDLATEDVFAVDPFDPNHLVVPDMVDNKVKVTFDGGQTWSEDKVLTKLVTQDGELNFSWNAGSSNAFIVGKRNPQITQVKFDPAVRGRILVGTMQAGFFCSCDNGMTWYKTPASEQIPSITGFCLIKDTVIISSYGRGLWRWRFQLPPCAPVVHRPPAERKLPNFPVIYWNGVRYPLSQLRNRDTSAQYGFYLVSGGDITGIKMNKENSRLDEITINSGTVTGHSATNGKMNLPFKISYGGKTVQTLNDSILTAILQPGDVKIKGLYLEGNWVIGLLLSNNDISISQLPQPVPPGPALYAGPVSIGSNQTGINKIILYGSGFHPGISVSVILDGTQLLIKEKIICNQKGEFDHTLKLPLLAGEHTIIIEQVTKEKTFRGSTAFFIPLQETEPGKQKK